MKILIINTSDSSGGAAVAARRLLNALLHQGIDANMLVQKASKPDSNVHQYRDGKWADKLAFLRFVGERLYFLPHEKSKKTRFAFSPANTGVNISAHPLVQEADIIHLHWVNGGFISLKGLKELFALGKPIVWTLHDMWPFTGGCHYSGECGNFKLGCGNCPLLSNPGTHDLSSQVFEKKVAAYDSNLLHVVGCSDWMAQVASESSLFAGASFTSIPNPIDLDLFKPMEKVQAKKELGLDMSKRHLLFGAMNTQDERKGFRYLKEALDWLNEKQRAQLADLELLVFGKADEQVLAELPFPVRYLGQISVPKQLVAAYSAANLIVTPSLQDNLPNTIVESLACGTPAVAFRIGGIPEMIVHSRTGYLANEADAHDLANGILKVAQWSKDHAHYCREFAVANYSPAKVAEQYSAVYQQALGKWAKT